MTPAATSTDGATIRVGNRTIPLAAIARAEPCVERQRDWLSPLTTLMLFMLAAAAIMVGVFTVGWRFYIILGTVLFAAIALSALDDLRYGGQLEVFRLAITTTGGERIEFATRDRAELEGLVTLLSHAAPGCLPRGAL